MNEESGPCIWGKGRYIYFKQIKTKSVYSIYSTLYNCVLCRNWHIAALYYFLIKSVISTGKGGCMCPITQNPIFVPVTCTVSVRFTLLNIFKLYPLTVQPSSSRWEKRLGEKKKSRLRLLCAKTWLEVRLEYSDQLHCICVRLVNLESLIQHIS